MKKIMINGVEVTTNYEPFKDYPMGNGERRATMTLIVKKDCHESAKEMLERCVANGYTRVTFYEASTRVRGYHSIYAYAK